MTIPSVISIGTFDGVHLGHRAILAHARRLAASGAASGGASGGDESAAQVVIFAFDPHPAKVLRPGSEPPRLITRAEKIRRLHAAGADRVVILEPSPELLGQEAEQFVEGIVAEHHPIAIVEGPDFRFGKGRRGDITLLRELGERFGFHLHVQEPAEVTLSNGFAATVSSSLVRWLVAHGRMLDAAICLAEPYVLTAPVVTGEQRGRTIGVPTVNLDNDPLQEHMIPPDGVYAGTVEVHPEQTPETGDAGDRDHANLAPGPRYTAALSIGAKPTFGRAPVTIEAHLLDFDDDLYGRTVSVRFARWLRDQVRFPSLESLQAQLQRDIAHTRWCEQSGLLDPPRQQPHTAQRAG